MDLSIRGGLRQKALDPNSERGRKGGRRKACQSRKREGKMR